MRLRQVLRKACLTVFGLIVLKILLSYFSTPSKHTETLLTADRDYVLNQDTLQQNVSQKRDFTSKTLKNAGKELTVTHINIFGKKDFHTGDQNEEYTASLKTPRGNVTMFIHKPEVDMISSYVKDYGTWEEEFLSQIGHVFFKHEDLVFLDIGCNIGVYTMYISNLGAKVVAIDAIQENLKLVSKSLEKANLSTKVTLIWNAVSDTHKTVSLLIPEGNIGGAHIESSNTSKGDVKLATVDTIVLDDLVDPAGVTDTLLKKDEKVFMKIDIEGGEDKALMTGQTFFQTVNVVGIFMEWMHHRYTHSGETIVNILVKEGFLPYETAAMTKFLNPDSYYSWPENVFWMKR